MTTINFLGELGSAANFTKDQTSLSMTTTAPVEVGNSVILEFAVKPSSKATNPPPALSAVALTPAGRVISFQLDATILNPNPGGGPGGAVQTAIFSLHDIADSPAEDGLPAGTVFTVSFDKSDAQSMTAAEFSGMAVTTELPGNAGKKALDRVATKIGDSSEPVTSGLTQPTRFANEILIGAIGVRGQVDAAAPDDETNNLGFTAGAGYTVWTGNGTPSGNAGNKNSSIHPEYRKVSSIGQYAADGVLNSNAGGPWAAIIATYLADPTSHFGITAGPDSDPLTPGVQIDAGSPFTLTVSALDDNNQVSTGFRGTVNFTVTDPVTGEVLPLDYTFTAADAGVHTFTNEAILLKAGPRTITVAETPDDPTITSGEVEVFIVAPTFSISDAAANEDDGSMTFTISLDRPIDIPVTVDVNFTDGTATGGGVDYSSLTQQVVFAANDTSPKQISVAITNDTIVEEAETFTAWLSTSTALGARVVDLTDTGTGTIFDTTDTATVSIAATDAAAAEPDDNGLFTVSLSAPSATPTVINYTVSGTAAAGSDYTALSGSVTIPANTLSAAIPVLVLDDEVVEGDETVIVTLTSIVSGDPQISVGSPNSATVTIADATDSASVSVVATDGAAEPADHGEFTVSLSAPSSTPTVVSYVVSGTAAAGSDYAVLSGTVTIPAFALSATIPVTVLDDNDVEGNETVVLTLGAVLSGDPQIGLGTPASATLVIADDDTTTVSISATDPLANETPTNPGQFTVTLADGKVAPAGGVLVSYTVGGSATVASDYAALSGSVLIPAGSGSATIDVTGIVDDDLVEADETVIVTLTGTSHVGVTVGAPAAATVTIVDNDAAIVTIDDVTADEAAGTMTFTLWLSNPIDTPFDVNVSYSDISTSAADFNHTPASVAFPTFSTAPQTVVVAITNDNVVETTETFLASLSTSAALGGRNVNLDDTALGTIVDDDIAAFTIQDSTVNEGAGTMTFAVSLSNPIDIPVVVNVAYVDGSTSAADFDHATDAAAFPALSTAAQNVTVAITNDNIVETAETFLAVLSTSTPLGTRAVDLADNATGTITDNDSAVVTINDVTANEAAGTMTFTVALSNPLDIPLVVNVDYSDISTSAADFDHTTGVAAFAALSTASQSVTVAITNDNVAETTETFLASLSTSAALDGRSIDFTDTGTGTITDNDSAVFTINDVTANESAGTMTFTIALSNPIDIPVAVNVNYSDISTSAADFDHTADTAAFAALSTAPQSVTVAITNDNVVETTETFLASLSTSTALGGRNVTATDTAIGTIVDNDTAIFTINDVSANESAGTLTFTVSLSSPVDTQVSVVATTANNTATTGDNDYTAKSATLTFLAGQTSQPFTVAINNDNKVEPNETFFVNLSSPSVAGRPVTIGDGQGVGQIINDDVAVVSIVANDPEATEFPVDNGQFTVSLSQPSSVTTVVSFVVSGTATDGSDYVSLTPYQVTFAPNATTAVIDLVPLQDNTAENDETVVVTLSSVVAGVPGAVSIAAPPNNSATVVIHDPTVTIIDNHDPGWEHYGFIRNASSGGYLQDYAYGGNNFAPEFARWTFDIQPGVYRVSVTWPNVILSPRATNAPFSVYDGTTAGTLLGTALINQTGAPEPDVLDGGFVFQDLEVGGNGGIYTITGNTLTVQLTDVGINGVVLADAVRAELLLPELGEIPEGAHAAAGVQLTNDLVAPVMQSAVSALSAAQPDVAARLGNVQTIIADLPQNVLGLASSTTNTIWLDVNAAGAGWLLDGRSASAGQAATRFDLATVVAHELGHLLGHADLDAAAFPHELMAGRLTAGTSKTPGATPLASAIDPPISVVANDRVFGAWGSDFHHGRSRATSGLGLSLWESENADASTDELRRELAVGEEARLDRDAAKKSPRRTSDEKLDRRQLEALIDELFGQDDELPHQPGHESA